MFIVVAICISQQRLPRYTSDMTLSGNMAENLSEFKQLLYNDVNPPMLRYS